MGQIIDPNSLLIKTDQQPATVQFFNNLISQICNAVNGVGVRMDGYDAAEQNLVNLGLANINSTLGPFLTTLQQAAQLGFLVAEADGRSLSLTSGQPFDLILTSQGASLFTPTKWLMALDVNDSTNWGILSLDSWIQTNLNLATHCIYASKTQASTSWQVCCGSGVLNAMVNDLNAATTAATNAANSASAAASAQTYVQSVAASIAAGPVVSVAGKTGAITLVESDISGLTTDLANRPTTTYMNSQLTGFQPISANLTQLSSSTLTAFGFALFQAANAAAAMATLGAAGLASPVFTGAPAAPTATAGTNTTQLATCAFVAGAISAGLASPVFTGTPVAPTATAGTNTTQLATCAFVAGAISVLNFVTPAQLTSTLTGYMPINALIPSSSITATFNDQTTTAYTMASSDYGKALTFTNASPIAVTLPNSLAKGWNVLVYQGGAGQVTFSPGTGATMAQRNSKTKTAGQYAVASLMVISNSSGTNAAYVLGGDVA